MYWSQPVIYILGKITAVGVKKASSSSFMTGAMKDAEQFFSKWRIHQGELVDASRKRGLKLIGRDRDRGASSAIIPAVCSNWIRWLKACKDLSEELLTPRPRIDVLMKTLSNYKFPGLGSGWENCFS